MSWGKITKDRVVYNRLLMSKHDRGYDHYYRKSIRNPNLLTTDLFLFFYTFVTLKQIYIIKILNSNWIWYINSVTKIEN